MNKNTLKAIDKRLASGMTDFIIGAYSYHMNDLGVLVGYCDVLGGNPQIMGKVENGKLNPDKIF